MKLLLTLAAIGLVATPALCAPCRDGKGKFVKCPAGTGNALTAMPARTDVTKDAKGKCHFASGPNKGKFTACSK